MTIAAVFLWGAVLALAAAGAFFVRVVQMETTALRTAYLARERCADAAPAPEPGPLTTDTMEPEDAAVVKKRNRRGYFA